MAITHEISVLEGNGVFLSIIFLAVFLIGFLIGHRLGVKDAQAEKAIANDDRLTVSMPVHKDDASKMLGLLRDLMEQVENDKADKYSKEIAACGNQ